MNRFRFYITFSGVRTEVYPLNHWRTSLVDEKESGKAYYRRKFNGQLQFTDNNGGQDFSLLYVIEKLYPCDRIIFEIEEKNSGANTYHNYWTGHFSTTDGEFDLDKCTFTITPQPYDVYMNFDLYGDTEYNILTVSPVITTKTSIEYTRNRLLLDVIKYIIGEIDPSLTVSSDFFTLDTNYVTETTNRLKYVTIAQKSDIKRPGSSGIATRAYITFNELMEILKMFNVYYDIDGTSFRVEHISYFTRNNGIDLQTQQISQRSNKYSYIKGEMPKYEKFAFMEAGEDNFVGVPIYYNSPCVNQDGKANSSEYFIKVTTDIEYIETSVADVSLSGNISDDGFVILVNYLNGGDYYVYPNTGLLGATTRYNMDLSWANLHFNYFRHDRILEEGYMNNELTAFASIKRNKLQKIDGIICYEDNYNANDLITTELGEVWLNSEKGEVRSANIKPDGHVSFELLYGVTTDVSGSSPEYRKILWVRDDGDLGFFVDCYLSEPAPYDMYFWLYVVGAQGNDCQEIMIPEGESYLHQLMDLDGTGIPVEYQYNFSDASTSGYSKVYNNHDTYIEVPAGTCGDVPPPPPVNPTATLFVGAGETWIITNEEATISQGSTTIYFEFRPSEAINRFGHLKIYRNGALDKTGFFTMRNGFMCYDNETVTEAQYGDAYEVQLFDGLP